MDQHFVRKKLIHYACESLFLTGWAAPDESTIQKGWGCFRQELPSSWEGSNNSQKTKFSSIFSNLPHFLLGIREISPVTARPEPLIGAFERTKCSICSKLVLTKNIAVHRKQHLPIRFPCSSCSIEFRRAYQLRLHEATHIKNRESIMKQIHKSSIWLWNSTWKVCTKFV